MSSGVTFSDKPITPRDLILMAKDVALEFKQFKTTERRERMQDLQVRDPLLYALVLYITLGGDLPSGPPSLSPGG